MSDAEEKKPQPKPKGLKIKLEEGVAGGRYSNLQVVASNETEFILDFGFIQPQEPKGTIHSRVILSPRHAKGLMRTLIQRIRAHEERNGEILMPGTAEKPPRSEFN